MKFAVVRNDSNTFKESLLESLVHTCSQKGDQQVNSTDGADYVLNLTTLENPRSISRKCRSLFVITLICGSEIDLDIEKIKAHSYNALVKSLSNNLIYISPGLETYFTTPEAGFYTIYFNPEEIYAVSYTHLTLPTIYPV